MKRLFAITLILLLSGIGSRVPAAAPADPPAAAMTSLFAAETTDPARFAPGFLAQVPAAQVDQIIKQLKAAFGAPTAVRISDGRGVVRFKDAEMPAMIRLDAQGRIETLWFGPPQRVNASVEDLAHGLREAASGDVAVFVTVDGKPVVDQNSDLPMAVGSAFKLVVLRAYEDAVAAGRLKRDQVTTLQDADRSLPTGVLQTLPSGTPVTLETLAELMIRISDNTAADALIRMVGRDSLQALSPRNTPFLDTRELFQLIADGADGIRSRYRSAGGEERQSILGGLSSAPLPEISRIGRTTTWRDVEWRLSARELCGFLAGLNGAPAMSGTTEPLLAGLGWPRLGFKGGSERGVLNLSALGETADGRRVCAVVTANGDGPQPEDRIAPLFADLLRAAATR